MPAYSNEILGSQFSNGKDFVLGPEYLGTTVDLYQETLVGGVTYGVYALGAANRGGTMLDPGVVILDSSGTIIAIQTDGPANVPDLSDPFWLWRGTTGRGQDPRGGVGGLTTLSGFWRGTTGRGQDPMFYFTPPISPPQVGTYYIGVFDQTGAIGASYTLLIEGAGEPVFFSDLAGVAGNAPDSNSASVPTLDSGSASSLPAVNSNNVVLPDVTSGNATVVPPDVTSGNTINDPLIGTAANEKLVGRNTNDKLFGNSGNDTLMGGKGNDTLFGGSGNNILVGGKGRDIFALEQGAGKSTVKDFQKRQDKLGLSPGLSFRSLRIEQRNNDTLISFRKDQLMLLQGVQSNQIRATDFTQF